MNELKKQEAIIASKQIIGAHKKCFGFETRKDIPYDSIPKGTKTVLVIYLD